MLTVNGGELMINNTRWYPFLTLQTNPSLKRRQDEK